MIIDNSQEKTKRLKSINKSRIIEILDQIIKNKEILNLIEIWEITELMQIKILRADNSNNNIEIRIYKIDSENIILSRSKEIKEMMKKGKIGNT